MLHLAGILPQIRDLILGHFENANQEEMKKTAADLLVEITQDYSFPIIQIGELGHDVQNYCFPIGCNTTIDADNLAISIDDFSSQFDDTFKHLEKTLSKFDLTLAHVVKVNVWLKNIEDLPEMEKCFNNFFKKDKFPARMTSTSKFIYEDCLLMIDGIAYRKIL